MAKRHGKSWLLVMIAIGLSWNQVEAGQGLNLSTIPMTLEIHDDATVPNAVLLGAQAVVTSSFASIGVTVSYGECGPKMRVACFRIYILSRSFLVRSDDALGVATKNSHSAHVFYDHINALVREFEMPPRMTSSLGLALGSIMTHELGHLLLPTTVDHRSGTIMRAKWKEADIRDVELHGARIAGDHASLMRRTLESSVYATAEKP